MAGGRATIPPVGKKFAIGIAAVVFAIVGGVGLWFYGLHPKTEDAPDVTADTSDAAIERGRYLANHVLGCAQCHSPIDGASPGERVIEAGRFSGRAFAPDDLSPGEIVAPNLTSDAQNGIGEWTDGELLRAIREGISRDGDVLFPMMPYAVYRFLTQADALAVVAYLRTLGPSDNDPGKSDIDFPVSMLVRVVPRPVETEPLPMPEDPVERGTLLLSLMRCRMCHTPVAGSKPARKSQYAGGQPFEGEFGTVYAANLTSDPDAGLGDWTDDELAAVFKTGRRRDGRLLWGMPWTAMQGLSDQDVTALIAALRHIPPNETAVPKPQLKTGYDRREGAL